MQAPFLKATNWPLSAMLTTLAPFNSGRASSSFSQGLIPLLGMSLPLLPLKPQPTLLCRSSRMADPLAWSPTQHSIYFTVKKVRGSTGFIVYHITQRQPSSGNTGAAFYRHNGSPSLEGCVPSFGMQCILKISDPYMVLCLKKKKK